MAMTLGSLPEGVDLEKELENRWEEWAKKTDARRLNLRINAYFCI